MAEAIEFAPARSARATPFSTARAAFVAFAALVALWLVSPILSAGHLEEITANLKMLAISANRGDPMGNDLLSPLVSQYHYVTRLGVVLLLQAIGRVFGEIGDVGFHGLIVVAFGVVCVSSIVIARRWSRVGIGAAATALVLTPGLFETAFFFNDNMISAAFALLALALVSRWNAASAYALAGASLAFAILCRTDAVVALPLLAGFAWLDDAAPAALAGRGGAAVAGGLAVVAVSFMTTHVSPLDSLTLAKIFLPSSTLTLRAWMALYFFGVPTLILLALGAPERGAPALGETAARNWRAVSWLYPLLVVALGIAKLSSEVRYVYPLLAPIIAIHAGAGVERVAAALFLRGRERRVARAAAALIALCLIAPPMVLTVHDGPRVLTGRLWSPLLWRRWQIARQQSMARIGELAAAIDEAPATLVLAGHYNDEYFLKLRLMEDGYRPIRVAEAFPSCKDGFAVYAKPGHVVAHIRSDNQYGLVPWPHPIVHAVQVRRALDCAALWSIEPKFLTAVGASSWGGEPDAALLGPALGRLRPTEAFSQTLAVPFALLFHPSVAAPADADTPLDRRFGEIETIRIDAADLAAINQAATKMTPGYSLTYEDVARTYRPLSAR